MSLTEKLSCMLVTVWLLCVGIQTAANEASLWPGTLYFWTTVSDLHSHFLVECYACTWIHTAQCTQMEISSSLI